MTLELLSHIPNQPTDKPPLLFLHGMGFGAWCWEEHFLPWFCALGYPSYAMSLRGHGNSPLPKGQKLRWVKLDDYTDDLAQIYNSFERPPILIGHSMGGFIVQKFLSEHPFTSSGTGSKPPAVILLASVPSTGILDVALQTLWHFPLPALKVLLTGSARPLLDNPDIFQKTLTSKTLPLEVIKRYCAKTGDESLRAFARLMLVSSPKRLSLPPPMLVVTPQDDAYIPVQKQKNTACYYHSDFTLLPDIGHLVMLDTNWEVCAQSIDIWLKQKGL